jgi:hypothetical protein
MMLCGSVDKLTLLLWFGVRIVGFSQPFRYGTGSPGPNGCHLGVSLGILYCKYVFRLFVFWYTQQQHCYAYRGEGWWERQQASCVGPALALTLQWRISDCPHHTRCHTYVSDTEDKRRMRATKHVFISVSALKGCKPSALRSGRVIPGRTVLGVTCTEGRLAPRLSVRCNGNKNSRLHWAVYPIVQSLYSVTSQPYLR